MHHYARTWRPSAWFQSISATLLPLLSLNAVPTDAKFSSVYHGIAHEGLQACLRDNSSFTLANITMRSSCGDGFACIMQHIDNSQQSILSAGSSTLGFIPTVMALLASPRSQTMAIHSRSWFLALLLSLTGANINDFGIKWGKKRQATAAANTVPLKVATTLGFVIVHVFASLAAMAIFWQTYDLGQKAVLSWACWTWFYPLIWLGLSILQHLLNILTEWLEERADHRKVGVRMLGRHCLRVVADIMGMIAYIAGTIIFASLTLVSGQNAVKVVAVYGASAILSRVCTTWVLETS